jgi:integrase
MEDPVLVVVDQQKKIKLKPGRKNGRNSDHVSGGVFVYKKLKNEIELILQANRDSGAHKDKKVGYETQEKRKTVVNGFFSDLFRLGYRVESVNNLKEKHLRAVFAYLEEVGQAPSTIQNKISVMRIFCEWIGKNGMVRNSTNYVKDKESVRRSTVVQEDKSWVGKGIDVMSKIAEVHAEDKVVAIQLEICMSFGLRVREAMSLKPSSANEGEFVFVRDGTKGGRSRVVPVENDVQRDVLKRAKDISDKRSGFLNGRGDDEIQRANHFYYVLRKCGITLADEGITAHGLRHQYMQESFKRLSGIEAPVRGGDLSLLDKDELRVISQKLMERAGHSRVSIGSAYYGSRRVNKPASLAGKVVYTRMEEKPNTEVGVVLESDTNAVSLSRKDVEKKK